MRTRRRSSSRKSQPARRRAVGDFRVRRRVGNHFAARYRDLSRSGRKYLRGITCQNGMLRPSWHAPSFTIFLWISRMPRRCREGVIPGWNRWGRRSGLVRCGCRPVSGRFRWPDALRFAQGRGEGRHLAGTGALCPGRVQYEELDEAVVRLGPLPGPVGTGCHGR
jgi:hypothetical protein